MTPCGNAECKGHSRLAGSRFGPWSLELLNKEFSSRVEAGTTMDGERDLPRPHLSTSRDLRH